MSTISAPFPRRERRARLLAGGTTQQALLLCGIGAACFYVAADLLGSVHWRGYHIATQTVSELSAIDSPSRAVVVPLMLIYGAFTIAFGIGVRGAAGTSRALRITGGCLLALGVLDLLSPFFPIHLRGLTPTTTDSVHVALMVAEVLLILVAISASAAVRDNWFRFFCFAAISTMVIFGFVSAMQAPQMVANLATPWLGITERVAIYAYLSWSVVLAVQLVRER
jgi:uncharacterized protein (UPF0548 family)